MFVLVFFCVVLLVLAPSPLVTLLIYYFPFALLVLWFMLLQIFWWLWFSRKRWQVRETGVEYEPSSTLRRIELRDLAVDGRVVLYAVAGTFLLRRVHGGPGNAELQREFLSSVPLISSELMLLFSSMVFAYWWYRLWWNGVRNGWVYALSGWVLFRLLWHFPDVISVGFLSFYVGDIETVLNNVFLELCVWLLACAGVVLALLSAYRGDFRNGRWLGLALALPFVSLTWLVRGGDIYAFDGMYSLGVSALAISNMSGEIGYQFAMTGRFRDIVDTRIRMFSGRGVRVALGAMVSAVALGLVYGLWLAFESIGSVYLWYKALPWFLVSVWLVFWGYLCLRDLRSGLLILSGAVWPFVFFVIVLGIYSDSVPTYFDLILWFGLTAVLGIWFAAMFWGLGPYSYRRSADSGGGETVEGSAAGDARVSVV